MTETRGRKPVEMVGKRFGKLLVKEDAGKNNKGRLLYRCICDCGKEKTFEGTALRFGSVISCGCQLKKNRAAYFKGILKNEATVDA